MESSIDRAKIVKGLQDKGYLYNTQEPDLEFFTDDRGQLTLRISGNSVLSAGEQTEEAHKAVNAIIRKLYPDSKVTTRWHYMTGWDWDDEYEGGLEPPIVENSKSSGPIQRALQRSARIFES